MWAQRRFWYPLGIRVIVLSLISLFLSTNIEYSSVRFSFVSYLIVYLFKVIIYILHKKTGINKHKKKVVGKLQGRH